MSDTERLDAAVAVFPQVPDAALSISRPLGNVVDGRNSQETDASATFEEVGRCYCSELSTRSDTSIRPERRSR